MLFNLISSDISADTNVLRDESTLQYQILVWMVETDQIGIEFSTPNKRLLIERYVLAHFYYSTNGQNWVLDGESVCSWFGIECDEQENSVTEIQLRE